MSRWNAVLLDGYRKQLDNPSAHTAYSQLLRLRHLCFGERNPTILINEPMDLIATHILVFDSECSDQPIAFARMVMEERLWEYKLPLPLEAVIHSGLPEHKNAFNQYRSHVQAMRQGGLMGIHPDYQGLAKQGTDLVEMMWWLALKWMSRLGPPNLCMLLNRTFKLRKKTLALGDAPVLADIYHPLVADPHDLILLETIRPEFMAAGQHLYGELYRRANLLDAPISAPKRAA